MLEEEDKDLMIASCNAVIKAKEEEVEIWKNSYFDARECHIGLLRKYLNAQEEIVELEALLQGAISEAEFKEYKRRTERAER